MIKGDDVQFEGRTGDFLRFDALDYPNAVGGIDNVIAYLEVVFVLGVHFFSCSFICATPRPPTPGETRATDREMRGTAASRLWNPHDGDPLGRDRQGTLTQIWAELKRLVAVAQNVAAATSVRTPCRASR